MKATEEDFLVILFIMLCKVVLHFESVGEILKRDHSILYFALQFKVVLILECLDEILRCDHPRESY